MALSNHGKAVCQGFNLALIADEKAKKQARKWMEVNGFKTTYIGKKCACNDLEQHFADDPEQSAFWQTVIMGL